jgi:CO/xanthine dehydrogenase Mo-binding subunit
VVVEMTSRTGPYGAKGVGEMTANSQAPAIINAIHDAIGVWIKELPATAEKVLKALKEKRPM